MVRPATLDVVVTLGVVDRLVTSGTGGVLVRLGVVVARLGAVVDTPCVIAASPGTPTAPDILDRPATPAMLPPTLPPPDNGDASPDRTPTELPPDTSCLFTYCFPASTTGAVPLTTTLKTWKERPLGNRVIY